MLIEYRSSFYILNLSASQNQADSSRDDRVSFPEFERIMKLGTPVFAEKKRCVFVVTYHQ